MFFIDPVNQKKNPIVHHLLIIEDDTGRQSLYLEEDVYTLGRHSSNSVVLESKKLSRFHATLLKRKDLETNADCYWILDGDLTGNKSHNGVFVNQNRCLVHFLKDSDVIHLGPDVKASYHIITEAEPVSTSRQKKIKEKQDTLSQETNGNFKQDNQLLHQQESLYDPLTNLATCSLFKEHLLKSIANIRRSAGQLAIITLEISNLELINPSLSNIDLDFLFKNIGERLLSCFRLGDIISSWSNHQFVILLPQIQNPEETIKIAQRLLRKIRFPVNINGREIGLKCHLGIALYPQDGRDGATLLRRSQIALSKNKNQEKNQYAFYSQTLNDKVHGILTLENLLKKAIIKKELFLQYQPRVNIRTGQIYGLEAFLRWQHPQFGLIMPNKYLDLVQNSPIMMPLSQWILKTVCSQIKQWREEAKISIPVAVNLSESEFYHPHLITMISEVLNMAELEANLLELDITEKTVLKNLSRSQKILEDLTRLGLRICLDDFGLGQSTLINLKKLPIHSLKIDQFLISKLSRYPQDLSIISAVIAWGQSFNFRIVAEGVETQEQLDILSKLACEEMQGYRFSKPLPVEEATTYLSNYTHDTLARN